MTCSVEAHPPVVHIHWLYNGTQHSHLRYNTRGLTSILKYQPRNRYDFGQLTCVAKNAVGEMVTPCHFEVIAHGKKNIQQGLKGLM